jgi:glycogen synthase
MKLLLYSHYFAPSIGGVETIVLSLARGLADLREPAGGRQFDVTLVTQTPARDYDDRSLPFLVVRQPGVAKLWRTIRDADLVHIAGPSLAPLLLARWTHKPYVVEHHGYQALCLNGVLVHQPDGAICPGHFQAGHYGKCLRCQAAEMSWPRSVASLLRMFPRSAYARGATQNIAISHHVFERQTLPRSSVIYYGIEDVPTTQVPAEASSGGSRKIRFAYLGRLVPEKGLPVLLAAAQILKGEDRDFEILLIGDGPMRATLETMIQRDGLGDFVRLTGFLQGARLAETLRGVSVVVMPSVWEETAGLAAIEQMMRGRLVIASRIGGLGEVVGDGGMTCEPGNPEDLARCIREVLRNPQKIAAIGRTGRERAHRLFLRERMIADHARLYVECAQRKNR